MSFNIQGSIVHAYKNSGASADSVMEYTPYGIQATSYEDYRHSYTGREFDYSSDTYYYRSRYYTPESGRFNRLDDARDGANWYLYVGNDPVNFVDPFGERLRLSRNEYTGFTDKQGYAIAAALSDVLDLSITFNATTSEFEVSGFAKSLAARAVKRVIGDEKVITINMCGTNEEPTFHVGDVYFNPNIALSLLEFKNRFGEDWVNSSPVALLIHELGHAYHYVQSENIFNLLKMRWSTELYLGKIWRSFEDLRVIHLIQNPIQKKLDDKVRKATSHLPNGNIKIHVDSLIDSGEKLND